MDYLQIGEWEERVVGKLKLGEGGTVGKNSATGKPVFLTEKNKGSPDLKNRKTTNRDH